MKKTSLLKVLGLATLLSANVQSAADLRQLRGEVSLEGSIVESPCSLDTGSSEQSVVMFAVPVAKIVAQGISDPHPFSIRLSNCQQQSSIQASQPLEVFRITFDAAADGNDFFLQGHQQGLALRIIDERGHIARPGISLPPHSLPSGDQEVHYRLHLVGNGKNLQEGDYNASIRYRLDYY